MPPDYRGSIRTTGKITFADGVVYKLEVLYRSGTSTCRAEALFRKAFVIRRVSDCILIQTDFGAYRITDRDLSQIQRRVFSRTPIVVVRENDAFYMMCEKRGGYVFGEGVAGTTEGTLMAYYNNYKVVAVDYRLAPEHPYPAAIDDAFAVYKELVKKYGAQNIAVLGTSTGGAMTLILALQCIEGGVPVPGALISGTPWSEMDKIGDSYVTNEGVDNILGTYDHLIKASAEVYAGGADLKDPLISPIYAKGEELAQFPPTLLVTGTRDLFLSNTARMHKLLLMNGAEAELLVYEAMSHAQYYLVPDAPETADHHKLMDMFLDEHFLKKN